MQKICLQFEMKEYDDQNANSLALGITLDMTPKSKYFALPIPTNWYPKILADSTRVPMFALLPNIGQNMRKVTQNNRRDPTQDPMRDRGIWSHQPAFELGMVGYVDIMLFVYFLFLLGNANTVCGGIRA